MKKSLYGCITRLPDVNVDILCLKLDNMGHAKPICLGVVYISPEGSAWHATSNVDLHRLISQQIGLYHDKGFDCIFVGDFNGRTGTLEDYTMHDNDSDHIPLPDSYTLDPQNLPARVSDDIVVNTYGHALLDICKASGVHIINGRYYGDRNKGLYTCHTPNGGHSVVDYVLGSNGSIVSTISDFEVGDMTILSADHCPLFLDTQENTFNSYNVKWKFK